jgi:predicted aldo/keto reductase-like oxidoreductase
LSGLTPAQQDVIDRARKALAAIPLIPCTSCNYCAKVCPKNIGISGTFTAMNNLTLYHNPNAAKWNGSWLVGGHGKKSALDCVQCGKCEQVCPQHIPIRAELAKAAAALGDLSATR